MQIAEIRDFLAAVPQPLVLFDSKERVLAANGPAEAFFGAALEGRECSSFMRHPDFLTSLETALVARDTLTKRFKYVSKGAETQLLVIFSPLTVDGRPVALAAIEDLTSAEQTATMRRDFIANVSHELRTPLTALVGFIDTLRGAARDDPAARDRFLGIMEREAGRMMRLVNDLLSLSRVEAEERRRPDQAIDILALVRSVLQSQRDGARKSGVEISLHHDQEAYRVRADGDQIAQVLHNLVENAVKYGGAGGSVAVSLRRLEHEPVVRGPAVQVEVVDKGEGIDPLHLPRLTERFYRIDTHRSREKGGTGLGLAIVKHIVNRHRGRLRIESTPGKGSNFIVILPLDGR
ncbi:MAG: two-component sensor histidine kinase [Rhodobacteraceae bacterium]|nr:two-component sensor histidine kinase [Paracoccaceae bacterium]